VHGANWFRDPSAGQIPHTPAGTITERFAVQIQRMRAAQRTRVTFKRWRSSSWSTYSAWITAVNQSWKTTPASPNLNQPDTRDAPGTLGHHQVEDPHLAPHQQCGGGGPIRVSHTCRYTPKYARYQGKRATSAIEDCGTDGGEASIRYPTAIPGENARDSLQLD